MICRLMPSPVVLALLTGVQVILWMPFGMGYYELPWEHKATYPIMGVFMFCHLGVSLYAFCSGAINRKLITVGLATLSILSGIWGVAAMTAWVGSPS